MSYQLSNSASVTDIECAFGTTKYLPKIEDIPEEFFKRNNLYVRLFNDIFFKGVSDLQFKPAEGFDNAAVHRLIVAHSRSFEPKHEHKESGVAYMMSLLMIDPIWTPNK